MGEVIGFSMGLALIAYGTEETENFSSDCINFFLVRITYHLITLVALRMVKFASHCSLNPTTFETNDWGN
jgi:hypothetical protein